MRPAEQWGGRWCGSMGERVSGLWPARQVWGMVRLLGACLPAFGLPYRFKGAGFLYFIFIFFLFSFFFYFFDFFLTTAIDLAIGVVFAVWSAPPFNFKWFAGIQGARFSTPIAHHCQGMPFPRLPPIAFRLWQLWLGIRELLSSAFMVSITS